MCATVHKMSLKLSSIWRVCNDVEQKVEQPGGSSTDGFFLLSVGCWNGQPHYDPMPPWLLNMKGGPEWQITVQAIANVADSLKWR